MKNRQVCVLRTLAVWDPELADEWQPTKNGLLTPDLVPYGQNNEVWWVCQADDPHEDYLARISARTGHGSGCPKCGAAASDKKPRQTSRL